MDINKNMIYSLLKCDIKSIECINFSHMQISIIFYIKEN